MIKKLTNGFELIFRVLKNALLRPFRVISGKIKYTFSVGRVTSAVPGAVRKLPKLAKRRPEKREDYFDWGRIYIAKSLVLITAAVIAALVLIYLLILRPLFTSWWWVKDFQMDNADLSSYTGRVRVYYDDEFTNLKFDGRLDDGKAVEYGEERWENGRSKYAGEYSGGEYSGSGILYLEDGTVLYRGLFARGKYNGSGELTENGVTLSGEFRNGTLEGSGTITQDGILLFTGNFTDGVAEGRGKENYPDGSLHYNGDFSGGVPHGAVLEYYPDGTLKYSGQFVAGKYSGEGTLYDEHGNKVYSGSFEMGVRSGTGSAYDGGRLVYSGGFEQGMYSGSGSLYGVDGTVTTGTFTEGAITGAAVRTYPDGTKYEGCFSGNIPSGAGSLTDAAGNIVYSGAFLDGDIDIGALVGQESSVAAERFPGAVRTVSDDCFRYADSSGILLECAFATESTPAVVTGVYALPVGGISQKILSATDVNAPSAVGVTRVDAALPTEAQLLGIPTQSATCYAVEYAEHTVYWWVSSQGELLMRSAEYSAGIGSAPSDENGNATDRDEIAELFKNIGLDIEDFASLGF